MIYVCRVYSFLGRSTGILGHNSINIEVKMRVMENVFGGQLFKLTKRGVDFFDGLKII